MKVLETKAQAILDKLATLEQREKRGVAPPSHNLPPLDLPMMEKPAEPVTEKPCRNCQRMLPLSAYLWNYWTKDSLTVRCTECLAAIWRPQPATERQIWLLRQHGHAVPEGLTKGEASDLIDAGVVQGRPDGRRNVETRNGGRRRSRVGAEGSRSSG